MKKMRILIVVSIKFLALVSVLANCSCGRKNHAADYYSFDFNESNLANITRITSYAIPDREWLPEEELVKTASSSKTIRGDQAKSIWAKLTEKTLQDTDLSRLKYTNEDYLVIAESAKGAKYAIMIGQTFIDGSRRLVGCNGYNNKWQSEVDESLIDLLGIK